MIKRFFSLGVTGSRYGMTERQLKTIHDFFYEGRFLYITDLHHGMCKGVDLEIHGLVQQLFVGAHQIKIHGHPAYGGIGEHASGYSDINPEKPPLKRNHDIVDNSHVLLVVPKTFKEVLRSGTWATWRYADKLGMHNVIVYPNGSIKTTIKNSNSV